MQKQLLKSLVGFNSDNSIIYNNTDCTCYLSSSLDISCSGLPTTVGFPKKPARFYVKIIVNNHTHQTPVAEDSGAPAWSVPILL
jgi:hypothetical protein